MSTLCVCLEGALVNSVDPAQYPRQTGEGGGELSETEWLLDSNEMFTAIRAISTDIAMPM